MAIARGSCYEVDAQLDLAYALGYVNEDTLIEMQVTIERTKRLINGLYNRYEKLSAQ